jgi:glycolate oxidase
LIGFDKVKDAALCIEKVMSEGMTPACMEFMDGMCVKACESFSGAGYPLDVEALMVVECDGSREEVDSEIERLRLLAEDFSYKHFRVSESEEERERIWRGRKGAFSAVARLRPDYMTMDGTIARGKLAEVLERIEALSLSYGILVGNVFHAGDGNMHPLILFDGENEGEGERALELAMETLRISVEAGGVISGEHGIGIEKRDMMGLMFSEDDMICQLAYKRAFDGDWLLNPGKVFPLDVANDFRARYT